MAAKQYIVVHYPDNFIVKQPFFTEYFAEQRNWQANIQVSADMHAMPGQSEPNPLNDYL